MYYGENPPRITEDGRSTSSSGECILVGGFEGNPIADSIQDNEIVKIYIRKETKKNK